VLSVVQPAQQVDSGSASVTAVNCAAQRAKNEGRVRRLAMPELSQGELMGQMDGGVPVFFLVSEQ
jgi:hypothetical protein